MVGGFVQKQGNHQQHKVAYGYLVGASVAGHVGEHAMASPRRLAHRATMLDASQPDFELFPRSWRRGILFGIMRIMAERFFGRL